MAKKGVYEEVTIKMTPAEAMSLIHGVLNKMPYPNVYPMVECASKIAKALGFGKKEK